LFIFSTPVLIRHLWQLKTVVFLHWCLMCVVLFNHFAIWQCSTAFLWQQHNKTNNWIMVNDFEVMRHQQGYRFLVFYHFICLEKRKAPEYFYQFNSFKFNYFEIWQCTTALVWQQHNKTNNWIMVNNFGVMRHPQCYRFLVF
jgi:hypothetical protein